MPSLVVGESSRWVGRVRGGLWRVWESRIDRSCPVTTAPLEFAGAAADLQAPNREIKGILDDKSDTGWSIGTNDAAPHSAFLRTREAFGFRA